MALLPLHCPLASKDWRTPLRIAGTDADMTRAAIHFMSFTGPRSLKWSVLVRLTTDLESPAAKVLAYYGKQTSEHSMETNCEIGACSSTEGEPCASQNMAM